MAPRFTLLLVGHRSDLGIAPYAVARSDLGIAPYAVARSDLGIAPYAVTRSDLGIAPYLTCQMSLAYSSMARSAAKKPLWAVFMMPMRAISSLFWMRS